MAWQHESGDYLFKSLKETPHLLTQIPVPKRERMANIERTKKNKIAGFKRNDFRVELKAIQIVISLSNTHTQTKITEIPIAQRFLRSLFLGTANPLDI